MSLEWVQVVLVVIKQRSWPISYVFLFLLLHNKDRKIFLELVKQKQEKKQSKLYTHYHCCRKIMDKSFVVQEYVLQERTISDFNITHLIMYVLPFLCNAISV